MNSRRISPAEDPAATQRQEPAPRRRGIFWKTALALVAAVVLLLPVVLLPLTTGVPVFAWLPLLLVGLAAVVWLVVRRRKQHAQLAGVGVLVLIAGGAVLASQVLSGTPPVTGPDGQPVPGSLAGVEKVELNGSEQWILVRGHDPSNPVLLNLGMGGPGGGGFFNAQEFRALEDTFTVVSWDEPGTGKSYGSVPVKDLHKERYVNDAVALTNLLRERFKQEKIFIYGVSWSSILGIWLVQEHPELYHAFVSSGQMVNTTENDRMGYELALQHLEEQGDRGRADELRRNGPPPYHGADVASPYVAFLDVLNEMMGSMRFSVAVPLIPFFVPEYGYLDKVNHTRGVIESFNAVYPQLEDLDFRQQALKLDVPVYFFVGRHDINAIASLVEDYCNALSAPDKKLIWLEGGHGLGSAENQDVFFDVMRNQVRAAVP
ncbi:alpha/beta hydrolase [Arthrobacter sp. B1I2]|uniref:alpha/beta hydrolase n=1 Tax=Arthrobacter sp. B1I2 TaxID=3042263 RepID=UPI0027856F5B|nr:alpha/beta hydrolase [Arthrobacter sp. B1I2]MDQ0731080.1 pimeloyl-ACP methyl ester carboxylesterase [Arthrobacter sp. B1I2]